MSFLFDEYQIEFVIKNPGLISDEDDFNDILFIYGCEKIITLKNENDHKTCSEIVEIWSKALLEANTSS